MHKITFVVSAILLVIVACSAELKLGPKFNPTLAEGRALSKLFGAGFMKVFVARLNARKAMKDGYQPKAPLLPGLPSEICFNATTLEIPIDIPDVISVLINHEMVTDMFVKGLDKLVDDLVIGIPNIIAGTIPVDYHLHAPTFHVVGDYISQIDLGIPGDIGNGSSITETTNHELEFENLTLDLHVVAVVLPPRFLNVRELTLALNATKFRWEAHWLQHDGTDAPPSFNDTSDIGPYIKAVVDMYLPEILPPVVEVVQCAINYVIGGCTLTDVINGDLLECLKLDDGWMTDCPEAPLSYHVNMMSNGVGSGKDRVRAKEECPSWDEQFPTEEPPTTVTGGPTVTTEPPVSGGPTVTSTDATTADGDDTTTTPTTTTEKNSAFCNSSNIFLLVVLGLVGLLRNN